MNTCKVWLARLTSSRKSEVSFKWVYILSRWDSMARSVSDAMAAVSFHAMFGTPKRARVCRKQSAPAGRTAGTVAVARQKPG